MAIISDYFKAQYGKIKEPFGDFNEGGVPFISSGDSDNGVAGFFDLAPIYQNVISVARTGSIGSAFYHPYKCAINSDCIVLEPKKEFTQGQMLAFVVFLRRNIYRYSYARKVTPEKLLTTKIPESSENFGRKINIEATLKKLSQPLSNRKLALSERKWEWFQYDDLFEIKRGVRTGESSKMAVPLVTSSDQDNGVMDYIFEQAAHPAFTISVNRIGTVGEAFLQEVPYSSTENVHVFYPKFSCNQYNGLFLVSLIRKEKYRYSYGRTWSMERMRESKIKLPVGDGGNPDWQFMEDYIKSLPYSSSI